MAVLILCALWLGQIEREFVGQASASLVMATRPYLLMGGTQCGATVRGSAALKPTPISLSLFHDL
eukprot:3658359-Amphidinium_carterae.1